MISGPQDGEQHDQREPDPNFLLIPKDRTGLLIWRIEQFELKPWRDFGSFYTGDSYLILNSYHKERSMNILRDIFFWIGSESTQDEYGTAAIKAVELDDFFEGLPVQYRETQFHESTRFLKLFDEYGGVRYMEGGVDSGFRKVQEDKDSILFHIKGRRNPVLQQVKLSGESLNQGDVFVLQTPQKIFLWIGKKANVMEKQKGNSVVSLLRSKHPKSQFERLDYGETTPEFWEALGGETPIKSADEAGNDQEYETSKIRTIAELRDGKFVRIASGPAATKSLLKSDGIYVIVCGNQCVIYSGANSDKLASDHAMITAIDYFRENDIPSWIPAATVREGHQSEPLDLIFA